MVNVELLAPAGNWKCLKAAVEEGADAVYFGAGNYNARRRAENFDNLGDVVDYCHKAGVRAYLAANTLVKNNEISDYLTLLTDAYSSGVDAFIIQETALAPHIKELMPDVEVHASTQATTYNSLYLPLLNGVDRVILPRELTINQIKSFRENTGLPVEVFVQGALCMSISGQCLMSSFLGGRSGNRGFCAQPCRKKYNNKYLLSTMDLCGAEKITQLIEAGVDSLKIEGRLRSPDYVGAATSYYRSIIDDRVGDELAYEDMTTAFSRNYTAGALAKSYDIVNPENAGKHGVPVGVVGADGEIVLQSRVMVGDGVGIKTLKGMHGDTIKSIKVAGQNRQTAAKGETTILEINAGPKDMITLTKAVKRRGPPKTVKKQAIKAIRVGVDAVAPTVQDASFDSPLLLAKVYDRVGAEDARKAGADHVFQNIFDKDYSVDSAKPYVPRCLSEWSAQKALTTVNSLAVDAVLCGDLGVAANIRGKKVFADLSANAFNDVDVKRLNELGVTPVISPELSKDELTQFRDRRFVVYAHGRLPLMTTKYTIAEDTLRDEKGYVFPTRREHDQTQVLNSVRLGVYDMIHALMREGVLYYLVDADEEVYNTVATYRRIIEGEKIRKPKGYTLGNYRDGVL